MAISVSRSDVQETECYKKMNPIVRKLTTSHNNMKILTNGVNIVHHRGYELFEKEHNFSWSNKLIIKELTDKKQIS